MGDQINFDEFMKDWNDSVPGHKPAFIKEKKQQKKSGYTPHGDGHDMINDLDKFIPSNPGAAPEREINENEYHNVWEFLKSQNINKSDIELVKMEFNNVSNIITSVLVTLVSGDTKLFRNIQLKEK